MTSPKNNEDRLRALTLNLWGEQEPLAPRMAAWSRELAALQPDVVALQEVRQIPGQLANTAETLAASLGYGHVFAGATEWGGGLEGLAILSRLPIVHSEHHELPHATPGERRILLRADVQLTQGRAAVFCTHLNYRLTHGQQREDQVEAIDGLISPLLALPEPERPRLVLLMGDFNATPESDEIRFLKGLHSLRGRRTYYQDAFGKLHPDDAGYTWSQRNPFTQRLLFLEPDRRLDYIFVSPMARDGRGLIQQARIVCDAPDGDGVFPSDHFGVMAEVRY